MTQNLWCSLYLTCADDSLTAKTVADSLNLALAGQGYTAYDPFGLIPGRVYDENVKLFVSPAEGWVRVLVEENMPQSLLKELSQTYTCLFIRVENPDTSTIQVYQEGKLNEDRISALAPFLREGKNPQDLHSALTKTEITIIEPENANEGFIPADALPEDIQRMAKNVDANNMNQMFSKVTSGLFGKMNADADAANALVEQAKQMNWNSPQGWKIRSLINLLTMPANWRDPNFVTLRDAYSLHARKQRKPDARLYPGDAEAMRAVPDALDYIPVYAGKSTP